MPERSDYDKAILFPQVRLRVQDPELKEGQVEKFKIHTATGTIERPWGIEGGFAVVYKYRTRNGLLCALRCFRTAIEPDIQFRYERIGAYFSQHASSITAHFKYHSNGILVKEQVQGVEQSKIYPLIEMEWIEGTTLLDHVDTLCQQGDQASLARLAKHWLDLLRTTRQANFAHGDLAGGNIMVRPDGSLVLIDYDGVYIPEFASLKPIVMGQTDYQHPQMNQRPFNAYCDDFSALVIYTALLALTEQPQLWETRVLRNNGKLVSTNLLFEQKDFLTLDYSPILKNLQKHSNARLAAAAREVIQACKQPVDTIRFPWHIAEDEQKRALAQLEAAIKSNDDAQICKTWIDLPVLHTYGPAQTHCPHVKQATDALQAFVRLDDALKTKDIRQVVSNYDPNLAHSSLMIPTVQTLVTFAQTFHEACQNNDEQSMVETWDNMQNTLYKDFFQLTPQEQQQLDQARQHKNTLSQFRIALLRGNLAQVATAQISNLDACQGFTHTERELILNAQAFISALQSHDDDALLAAHQQIKSSPYASRIKYTSEEQQRLAQAQHSTAALTRLRTTLAQKNAQEIRFADDPLLRQHNSLTAEEQTLLEQVKDFYQAYYRNNDEDLYRASIALQGKVTFTPQEQQRITRARHKATAQQDLRDVLASQQLATIAACFTPDLKQHASLSPTEYTYIELAHTLWEALQAKDEARILAAWDDIQNTARDAFQLTPEEQQQLKRAKYHKAILSQFRIALMLGRLAQIAATDASQLDACPDFTTLERTLLLDAQNFVRAYQANDNAALDAAYQQLCRSPYAKRIKYTQEEQENIAQAQKYIKALDKWHAAIAQKNAQAIRYAYDHLLQQHNSLTAEELTLLEQVKDFCQAYYRNNDEELYRTSIPLQGKIIFTPEEQQRIKRGEQRMKARNRSHRSGGASHA